MQRWRAATAVLWRTEPALALGLYFLLAAGGVAYVRLFGPHPGHGLSPDRTGLLNKLGSSLGLAEYAFFTWRMWLGGSLSWSLSLVWKLIVLAGIAFACYRTPSYFLFGMLALTLASVAPLFAPAVLNRVDRRNQRAAIRAHGHALPGSC